MGPFELTCVKNDWWGVWPSYQMIKNCRWPIWAPKSGKNLRPKKRFSQFWFLGRKIFLCKKSHQYPNSNSPLFGPIVEKRIESFSRRYCQFGPGQKVGFFVLGPKYRLIPSGAIWANVREKLLMGRPSCQMMKKCCWPIWAPKSGKNFRPKKRFSQICVFEP